MSESNAADQGATQTEKSAAPVQSDRFEAKAVLEALAGVLAIRGGGAASAQPSQPVAARFLERLTAGDSPTKALCDVCNHDGPQLANLLFGKTPFIYDEAADAIVATQRARMLRVTVRETTRKQASSNPTSGDSLSLDTDFRSFALSRDIPGQSSRVFAVSSLDEFLEEVSFVGSLWASVFPQHHAIVCRTAAFSFSHTSQGALFARSPSSFTNAAREERRVLKRLNRFCTDHGTLLSLDAMRIEFPKIGTHTQLLSTDDEGAYRLRRYSPNECRLFDYGEPAGAMTRGDFVTTYLWAKTEFHREFFLAPKPSTPDDDELFVAAFHLLHMLAIRRSKLFRLDFASDVYTILLAPAVLGADGNESDGYALFPVVNLYRVPTAGEFRRTLSLTFIAMPIASHAGAYSPREADLDELHKLKDMLLSAALPSTNPSKKYAVAGPLCKYLPSPSLCSIPEFVRHVSSFCLESALKGQSKKKTAANVQQALFTSSLESRLATVVLQVDWAPPEGYSQPWERWLANGSDSVFSNSVFRTLFYGDYLAPHAADTSRRAVRFQDFNAGDSSGVDMTGMTLFNPQDTLKVVLYPRKCERYPNYSMVRWMAWQVYIDSALTSLRALIYKVHPVLSRGEALHQLLGTLREMVQEFALFYDLDIRDYFYRREYAKLRTMMQVDADYQQLLAKFASAKEEASLREQRLINKLVIALTVVTVSLTIVSTVATTAPWKPRKYATVALGLSVVGVFGAYLLFDGVSRLVSRVVSKLRALV